MISSGGLSTDQSRCVLRSLKDTLKTSFVRKKLTSLCRAPWGLPKILPASEIASPLHPLPLTPAGRACPWGALEPWAGEPWAGTGCRWHRFPGHRLFLRVTAGSAVCGLCPRGLTSCEECAQRVPPQACRSWHRGRAVPLVLPPLAELHSVGDAAGCRAGTPLQGQLSPCLSQVPAKRAAGQVARSGH